MTFQRRNFDRLNDEHGGSVVETALIVPIFVVLVYWSALFYDIVQLRLKVQEASRFAAWEMTSYELSDYRTSDHDSAFGFAAGAVRARTDALYSSLHSEDRAGPHPRLMVTYTYDGVALSNEEVLIAAAGAQQLGNVVGEGIGSIAFDIMDTVDDALRWVLRQYGFNTSGMITAEVRATVTPRLIPQRLLQREDGGFYTHQIIEAAQYNLSARTTLLADPWTLHFGESVRPTGSSAGDYGDNPYWEQINRGHMLGLHQVGPIGVIVDTLHDLQAWIDDFIPLPLFTRAHLASMNYEHGDGRDHMRLDTGAGSQKQFHTNPSQEHCRGRWCRHEDSEYGKTIQMRGRFYMGCPQGEHDPGRCDWNTVR